MRRDSAITTSCRSRPIATACASSEVEKSALPLPRAPRRWPEVHEDLHSFAQGHRCAARHRANSCSSTTRSTARSAIRASSANCRIWRWASAVTCRASSSASAWSKDKNLGPLVSTDMATRCISLYALRVRFGAGTLLGSRRWAPPGAASTRRSAPSSSTASTTSCRATSSICVRVGALNSKPVSGYRRARLGRSGTQYPADLPGTMASATQIFGHVLRGRPDARGAAQVPRRSNEDLGSPIATAIEARRGVYSEDRLLGATAHAEADGLAWREVAVGCQALDAAASNPTGGQNRQPALRALSGCSRTTPPATLEELYLAGAAGRWPRQRESSIIAYDSAIFATGHGRRARLPGLRHAIAAQSISWMLLLISRTRTPAARSADPGASCARKAGLRRSGGCFINPALFDYRFPITSMS